MNSKHSNQNQAKGWFLTFPKCDTSKEQLLEQANLIGDVSEYVISTEMHADGTPHLHAFFKFSQKKRFAQLRFTKHGNYQVAKSFQAVRNYVMKGGDFITNINLDNLDKKQAKFLTKEHFDMDPLDLIDQEILKPMQLTNFLKNQAAYQYLKKKKMRETFSKDYDTHKNRHYWIYGPPNSGKTTRLQEFLKTFPSDDVFQIPYNNDWHGYTGERILWADEYRNQLTIQQLNRICDGGAKVNTKGSSVTLHPAPQVFIASNYDISSAYSDLLKETLKTRFNEMLYDYRENNTENNDVLEL